MRSKGTCGKILVMDDGRKSGGEKMTTNYKRGYEFERKVRIDMEGHGYIAIRSPSSRTPADVYCIGVGKLVFIQCKRDGTLLPKEWNKFLAYCESVGATPILAMVGKNGRGIAYKRITGYKEARKPQPMVDWVPEEGGRRDV